MADSHKSVDNFDLVAEMKRASVHAYEVAAYLGIDAAELSRWLNGKRSRLPLGEGRPEFREALRIVAERKAAA